MRCDTENATYLSEPTWLCNHTVCLVANFLDCCRFCGFYANEQTSPLLVNSIVLSHWGLKDSEVPCEWHERLHSFYHCLQRDLKDELREPGTSQPCHRPDRVRSKTTERYCCWTLVKIKCENWTLVKIKCERSMMQTFSASRLRLGMSELPSYTHFWL